MERLSTKEKILNAARQLFLEHGFAGTSMGNIAKLAEINHSLIFHHFGNKEQLWVAVKKNIVEKSMPATRSIPSSTLPFKDFLSILFEQQMAFYRNNPDIVRMINWQRLENTDTKIGLTLSAEAQAWIDTFKEYQKKGDLNPHIKPEFMITLILSIISSATLDPNVFIAQEKDKKNYIDFCLNLLGSLSNTDKQ